MHTLHGISTRATSKEDAFNKVEAAIFGTDENSGIAPWSDWCEVGGGRWNDTAPLNGVISYDEDQERFINNIKRIHSNRCNQLTEALERSNWEHMIREEAAVFTRELIIPNPFLEEHSPINMETWYLAQISGLLNSEYGHWAYYYDLEAYASDLQPLLKRINEGEPGQYLVLVDFHH